MIDTYRHKGLRNKLAALVKGKGIADQRIIDAIAKVPRHFFLDSSFVEFAYEDKPFAIGSGQTISQPYTVAFQTELLQVKTGDKVLEIGTGSGYQACILLELGAKVFSLERHHSLYVKTKALLSSMGYNARLFYGDGFKGQSAHAPFDKILITAAPPEVPQELLKQLKVGGVMVMPLGAGDVQVMTKIIKVEENLYKTEEHGAFRFVPMLQSKE